MPRMSMGTRMRHLIGLGTPRGLQGRLAAMLGRLWVLRSVRCLLDDGVIMLAGK